MKTISEMAGMLGKDTPFVRKQLARLDSGHSSASRTEKLFRRTCEKRGINIEGIGSFPPLDRDALAEQEVSFARDWATGEIPIGLVPTFANKAILGCPASGKSELIKLLSSKFMEKGLAQVKLLDFLGNFAELAKCCRNCVNLETPSINILVNEGVPWQRWINVLFDLISFHTDTMSGGRGFLHRVNSELGKIFHGTGKRPCLHDLSDYMTWLLKMKKLNMSDRGYCERINGKLVSEGSESGDAFSCQRGLLEAVENYHQIISLKGLSEDLQRFYVSVVIARDFMRRLFNPDLRRKPLIIVVDECKHIFSRKDERPGIRSAILTILTQTRNQNMYWFLATQEPSQLAHTCLANSNTKIVLKINEGFDLSAVQQSLRLNSDQVREIARFSEPGQAVVNLSGYPEPFLARIDQFDPMMGGNRNEISEQNRRLAERATADIIPKSGVFQRMLISKEKEKDSRYGRMSNSAKRLLEAYGREPYKPLVELYKASGLGTKGSKAKKELCMEGFIGERDLSVKAKKGSGKHLLNITEKGKNWIRECGIRPKLKGKGGPREMYYSVSIEEWARSKGFLIEREYKGADLMLFSKGNQEKTAVEIACRKDNQMNNLKRDLESAVFGKIVMVFEDEKVLKAVENEFNAAGIDTGSCKVSFLPVTSLML